MDRCVWTIWTGQVQTILAYIFFQTATLCRRMSFCFACIMMMWRSDMLVLFSLTISAP